MKDTSRNNSINPPITEPSLGQIKLMSFGFKYGLPPANYYFDVSFAKNPARQKNWGMFGVIDNEMTHFVLSQPKVSEFIELVIPLIAHIATLDSHQIIAFGCNAGRHRSPIVVDEIARRLTGAVPIITVHRDKLEHESFVAWLTKDEGNSCQTGYKTR